MSSRSAFIELERSQNFKRRLEISFDGLGAHRWYLDGRDGTVEIWARPYQGSDGDVAISCGAERHSAQPFKDTPPDHPQCYALGGRPCWHDGTSLWASENIEPLLLTGDLTSVTPVIFSMAEGLYRSWFDRERSDDE